MIAVDTYRDRTAAVFGLGLSGRSAARALVAGGARVTAWDDSADRRRAASTVDGVTLERPGAAAWRGISALVLSPGVPLSHPEPHPVVRLAEGLGIEILGDVELFAQTRPAARVVAITGTNGKSTTTALLGHLLGEAGRAVEIGANLGRPVLDLEPLGDDGIYVFELSSYQLDLTRSLAVAVAVWLNLSPDHLERHGGMAGYVAAKRRLFDFLGEDAVAIVGIDDAISAGIARALQAAGRRVVPVTVGATLDDGIFVVEGEVHLAEAGRSRVLLSLLEIDSLSGRHNWQNGAVATAVALELGLGPAAVAAGLASFPGLAHALLSF